jgi:hypothetical protein
VGTITGAGHYTIVGGTGDYRAASGQGTFTQRATVLFRRAPTGCTSSVMTLVGTTTLTGLLSI